MRKTMRIQPSMSGFCLLTMLICTACGTYVKVMPLTQTRFAPTASCEVYTAAPPTQSFTEIAVIEVYEGGNTIAVAQKKAMALGANAIFLKGSAAYGSMEVTPGIAGTVNKQIFVAIRWK